MMWRHSWQKIGSLGFQHDCVQRRSGYSLKGGVVGTCSPSSGWCPAFQALWRNALHVPQGNVIPHRDLTCQKDYIDSWDFIYQSDITNCIFTWCLEGVCILKSMFSAGPNPGHKCSVSSSYFLVYVKIDIQNESRQVGYYLIVRSRMNFLEPNPKHSHWFVTAC